MKQEVLVSCTITVRCCAEAVYSKVHRDTAYVTTARGLHSPAAAVVT